MCIVLLLYMICMWMLAPSECFTQKSIHIAREAVASISQRSKSAFRMHVDRTSACKGSLDRESGLG